MKKIALTWILSFLATVSAHAADADPGASTEEFRAPWFTANKSHQYLGLSSFALAGLAVIAPKPSEDSTDYSDNPHHQLALAASYLAGAAVASGVVLHYKDINWHSLKDPDTLHALLGTIAAVGFAAAVSSAPEGGHADAGILGFASMAAAIKITW